MLITILCITSVHCVCWHSLVFFSVLFFLNVGEKPREIFVTLGLDRVLMITLRLEVE